MSGLNASGTTYFVDDDDDSPQVIEWMRQRMSGVYPVVSGPFGVNGKPCPIEASDAWRARHAELFRPRLRGGMA